MAELKHHAHINLLGNSIIQALLDPQATNPASPAEGQVWVNTTTDRLMIRLGGSNLELAFLSDVTSNAISGTLWDAQSVVVAVQNDTPTAVILPENSVLGRVAGGNIAAVTSASLKTMLSIPAGSLATETYVTTAINNLIGGASAAYDTLLELQNALTSNDSEISALTSSIAGKVDSFAANIGTGSATTISVVHNLGTNDVVVSSRIVQDNSIVLLDWKPVSTTTIEIAFNVAPTLNQLRVVVAG